eukprot:5659226-Prymnesium_polylepis.1
MRLRSSSRSVASPVLALLRALRIFSKNLTDAGFVVAQPGRHRFFSWTSQLARRRGQARLSAAQQV